MRKKKQGVLGRNNDLLSFSTTGPHRKLASNNSSIIACVLVAAGTWSPRRCLAMIGRMHTKAHRQKSDLISLFFLNKESSLKGRTLN
jgi:hypothetical protein